MIPRPKPGIASFLPILPLLLVLLPRPAAAEPRALEDSTRVDTWTLANGLRVAAHHVPGARSVAMTIAVPVGRDADPAGRGGLARVAAEVQMMGAAGEVPERTRVEMETLRPLGWSVKVTSRFTQLSEVARRDQFPGVLRQMATRMRGVTVSDALLKSAVATTRRELGEELFGPPEQSLYFQVREYALGHDEKTIVDLAAAKGLGALRAKELELRLRREFAARHAVLAIAGDLEGINLRALIENEFGSLPPGDPLVSPPPPPFKSSARRLVRAEVDHPVGVVGVFAPSLADTTHPQFFLTLLVMGQHVKNSWPPELGMKSRFSYSILDEPDLVRFFPKVPADSTDATALSFELSGTLAALSEMIVMARSYEEMIGSVAWMLGGAMPRPVLETVRRDGAALNYLCNALATRELDGGEPFWSRYRDRFDLRRNPQLPTWCGYVAAPRNQAMVLLTPRGVR